jgi:hypothetical protein
MAATATTAIPLIDVSLIPLRKRWVGHINMANRSKLFHLLGVFAMPWILYLTLHGQQIILL